MPVLAETWDEDATGKCEGDELDAKRAQRPPDVRFRHIEKNHDELKKYVVETLSAKVDATHGDVREMKGKLDTALAFITENGKTQRTKISTNGKIVIAIVTSAIATIGTVLVAVLT